MKVVGSVSRLSRALCVCTIAAPGCIPGSAAEPARPVLDEVQVFGERVGPAMWKVSKGDHTMWIFATLSPLPEKMIWRSKAVEDVIRRSGQVLTFSHFNVETPISSRAGRRKLRDVTERSKSTLSAILPPDTYARWAAAYRDWYGMDPDAHGGTRSAGGTRHDG